MWGVPDIEIANGLFTLYLEKYQYYVVCLKPNKAVYIEEN